MVSLTTHYIKNMYDVEISHTYYFTCREKAEQWAKDRHFNITSDPQSDNDVTIELISFEG